MVSRYATMAIKIVRIFKPEHVRYSKSTILPRKIVFVFLQEKTMNDVMISQVKVSKCFLLPIPLYIQPLSAKRFIGSFSLDLFTLSHTICCWFVSFRIYERKGNIQFYKVMKEGTPFPWLKRAIDSTYSLLVRTVHTYTLFSSIFILL